MLNENQLRALSSSTLFRGIEPREAEALLGSSGAVTRRFFQGETIVGQGEQQAEICIILSGRAVGEKLSADGKITIVNEFTPGHVFGDVLSGASEESPVTVKMTEGGEIIMIPLPGLLGLGAGARARETVIRNLINEIADKYFALLKRLDIILCPTLRGKIAKYLLSESGNGKKMFTISHSREEQARILSCDRSALSRELSRMKREGIITYSDRYFEILDMERLLIYL